MEKITDKQIELLNDLKASCGCYELGDACFDRTGEYTHELSEECYQ